MVPVAVGNQQVPNSRRITPKMLELPGIVTVNEQIWNEQGRGRITSIAPTGPPGRQNMGGFVRRVVYGWEVTGSGAEK